MEAARGWEGWIVNGYLAAGLLAVVALDVFFVLSGFLITGILLDSRASPSYFRTFYLRRFVRIVPLYYAFLLVYLVVVPALVPWEPVGMTLSAVDQLAYWAYGVNLAYALHWPLAPYTGHLWTLSIEEQFYLVWPLVVWRSQSRTLLAVCLGCLVLAPVVRALSIVVFPETLLFYTFTLARLDGLALGSLIAVVWREPGSVQAFLRAFRHVSLAATGTVTAIVGLAIIGSGALTLEPSWGNVLFLTASAYCAGGVVVAMLQDADRPWHRLAKCWPLRRIGLYSYAIYVLHDPLAYVLDRSGVLARPSLGDDPLGTFGYFMLMSLVTIAAGAGSWHLFERPLLRLRPAPRPPVRPAADR